MFDRLRHAFVVSLLPASLALTSVFAVGCGSSASTNEPATASAAATRAPIAQNSRGPIRLVGLALGEVALRPDQRVELEKLAADADARHADAAKARGEIMLALADQVEKGAIDKAALKPKIDAAVAAWEKIRPADRAALERVHAILDTTQRVEFVAALTAKAGEHKMGRHHAGDAPQGERPAPQGENRHHRAGFAGGHDMMMTWARDLKLSDEQKTSIRTAMQEKLASTKALHTGQQAGGEHHRSRHGGLGFGQMKKVLEAFKTDHFVMNEIAPAGDAHQQADAMTGHMISMSEVVLPILTAEQRTIAAQKIREQAKTAK